MMKLPPGTKPRSAPTAAATSVWRTSNRLNLADGKLKLQNKVSWTSLGLCGWFKNESVSTLCGFWLCNILFWNHSFPTQGDGVSSLTCCYYYLYKESFELPVVTLFPEMYHIAFVLLLGQYLIKVLSWFQNNSSSSAGTVLMFFLEHELFPWALFTF